MNQDQSKRAVSHGPNYGVEIDADDITEEKIASIPGADRRSVKYFQQHYKETPVNHGTMGGEKELVEPFWIEGLPNPFVLKHDLHKPRGSFVEPEFFKP